MGRIQSATRAVVLALGETKSIPFDRLDIKKMKGQWQGFYRLRIGDIRIVFTVELNTTVVIVHAIGSRGDIYNLYSAHLTGTSNISTRQSGFQILSTEICLNSQGLFSIELNSSKTPIFMHPLPKDGFRIKYFSVTLNVRNVGYK